MDAEHSATEKNLLNSSCPPLTTFPVQKTAAEGPLKGFVRPEICELVRKKINDHFRLPSTWWLYGW